MRNGETLQKRGKGDSPTTGRATIRGEQVLAESTLRKLQGIRKCSIHGHKVKNLLQIILNAPDLWEQAYGNISRNTGGMTPGVDGLTLDGYAHERAANLRALLRENR